MPIANPSLAKADLLGRHVDKEYVRIMRTEGIGLHRSTGW